jgi:hypothetical protein
MKRMAGTTLAVLWLMVALFAAGSLAAHDGKKHFMGTVTRIDPNLLTIEAKDAKTVELVLTASTAYVKDKKPAKFQDLALGDRVVVHATAKGAGFQAEEVEIAPPQKMKPNS